MLVGVIADDFTGGTDIASFLVKGGLSTIQLIGAPLKKMDLSSFQAVVISLKSRSDTIDNAISSSLKALSFLQSLKCEHIIFKYCSTFDSTSKGNIGPVTDAILNELGLDFTILSPALPINGREVFNGYLFVKGQILSDSPMKNHPITPMTDSYIPRLMEAQSSGYCGVIPYSEIIKGEDNIKDIINKQRINGYKYACLDAISQDDLVLQAKAVKDMKFITGGSGIGYGLAKVLSSEISVKQDLSLGKPNKGHCVVLSGSCSEMTNKQVNSYKQIAPSLELNIVKCLQESKDVEIYCEEVCEFILNNISSKYAPLVYATATPLKLAQIQNKHGSTSSHAIEKFFFMLSKKLKNKGITKFIVAGGETSGQVTNALSIQGLIIGPDIAPGVPWVKAFNEDISLALKSGNFGSENFFVEAQGDF